MKYTSWKLAQVKLTQSQKSHPALYAYCLPSNSVRDEHSDDASVLQKLEDHKRKQLQIKELSRKRQQTFLSIPSNTQNVAHTTTPTNTTSPSPSVKDSGTSSSEVDQSNLTEEDLQEARNALKQKFDPLPLRGHTMKRRLIRPHVRSRKKCSMAKKRRLTGSQRRVINARLKEINAVEGHITVKTITGSSFIVPFCSEASVETLKVLIEVCRDTPKRAQHLYFNNEHLDDTCTLGHYGIRPNDEIWLIPELAASGEVSASGTKTESTQKNESTSTKPETHTACNGCPDNPMASKKSNSKAQTRRNDRFKDSE